MLLTHRPGATHPHPSAGSTVSTRGTRGRGGKLISGNLGDGDATRTEGKKMWTCPLRRNEERGRESTQDGDEKETLDQRGRLPQLRALPDMAEGRISPQHQTKPCQLHPETHTGTGPPAGHREEVWEPAPARPEVGPAAPRTGLALLSSHAPCPKRGPAPH